MSASQPVWLVIGPPGAGKTAALAAGGEAVFVDTPGRFTIQDPASQADRKDWKALLSKFGKGGQPLAGVVVAVSLEDLMTPNRRGQDVQVNAIRMRLEEIGDTLDAVIPAYVLFTKADLIPGFAAFMGRLDEGRRRGIWGATFQAPVSGSDVAGDVPREFDALAGRIGEQTADRLHEEPDPAARVAAFGFPLQFAALKGGVTDVLGRIFGASAQRAGVTLRGFYFSSTRSGGFFLHDLLTGFLPAESRRAMREAPAGRPATILRYGAMAAVAIATVIVLGAWGISFATNRSLIATVDELVERDRAEVAGLLGQATVGDMDLEMVAGVLATLRDLPVGHMSRDVPTPVEETFGLSQRAKLQAAAETAYREALERMLRPRLLLRIEQAVQAGMMDPVELYEPLKVYLMLSGQAPAIDDEMIVAWFARDWELNRYPGPANREGREELEDHLRAMLALDEGRDPAFEPDRPLVETAQRSLSRMDMAEFAWALIRSAGYSAQLEDFTISVRAGPQSAQAFEAADGSDIATLAVPGLYTRSGFNGLFLPQLATVAQRVVDDQWIMGAGGEQVGVEQQLRRLGADLLDRYGKEFMASWNSLFDRLKLKPLTEDRPDYAVLYAISSPTSPLRTLVEAIAEETGLTRALHPDENPSDPGLDEAAMELGLARIGLDLASGKSQNRAGSAFANPASQVPGASIEAQFRPFQMLVDGGAGRRPVDALVQNLNVIYQSLVLAAGNPMQAERAKANLQLQVHNLRANASRLPRQLAAMVNAAADEFESDAARASIAQLSDLLETAVIGPCQAIVTDAYPFARGSHRDMPIADFARLFAPGGEFERFFAQNLAPLTDISGQQWQWRQDSRLGRELSATTLRAFQQAAQIRDTFFPSGGATPEIEITFTPFSLHGDADMALLDVNGQIVQSYQAGNVPVTVNWPDSRASGSVNLSLAPEIPGRAAAVRFEGPWALVRLLDTGTVTRNDDGVQVQFVIGGRDVAYTIRMGSQDDPLMLPTLSEFRCPNGL